jgi:hypothetical protein
MKISRRSATLALAAAAIVSSGIIAVEIPTAEAAGSVKCYGINSCAGHGGNNACKGQGVVSTTRAKCLAAGGKIVG